MFRELDKRKVLEWFGVITAIIYSLLVASNSGFEFRVQHYFRPQLSLVAKGTYAIGQYKKGRTK